MWDVCITNSLKGATWQNKGKGIRRRVAPTTMLPKNWRDFLRVDENKTELFKFLSQQVTHLPIEKGKVIYATNGTDVLSTMADADMENLAPCSHEEADTGLLLHVADAVQKGYKKTVCTHSRYRCCCIGNCYAHPSLLDKLQAPWLSNLGQKRCVQANRPPVGKKRSRLTMQFQTFANFLYLCKWILVLGLNNCKNNGAK